MEKYYIRFLKLNYIIYILAYNAYFTSFKFNYKVKKNYIIIRRKGINYFKFFLYKINYSYVVLIISSNFLNKFNKY